MRWIEVPDMSVRSRRAAPILSEVGETGTQHREQVVRLVRVQRRGPNTTAGNCLFRNGQAGKAPRFERGNAQVRALLPEPINGW